eukprot:TRINITY_DN3158_c0_g1_i2.p1 TRINITY_DN3158_c0_g1~~TRINITY_DN3158_c0_g1_i2.p1  ORF type:complete len:520 (+),score=130.88 TRINITY_DN3158_c0_g1_i2:36-1562(+)
MSSSLSLKNFPPGNFTYKHLEDITEKFATHNIIGDGGFGVVYKGKGNLAVKVMKDEAYNTKDLGGFRTEIEALLGCDHPRIVKLLGYCVEENHLCLVSELMKRGNLRDAMTTTKKDQIMTATQRIQFALDIAEGMKFLHNKGIIHRDLKPENVLLNERKRAHISDCGLAKVRVDGEAAKTLISNHRAGTELYMAPELDNGIISPFCDVFSFGVVLYEFLTSLSPRTIWVKLAISAVSERNLDKTVGVGWDQFNYQLLFSLAKRCISDEKEKRIPFEQLIKGIRSMCANRLCKKCNCYTVFGTEEPTFAHFSCCNYTICTICDPETPFSEVDCKKHHNCIQYGYYKKMIESALMKEKMRCPNPLCGEIFEIQGESTHARCSHCELMWCIVCGESFEISDLDKQTKKALQHNNKWIPDTNKCPHFMSEVNSFDKNYPNDNKKGIIFLQKEMMLHSLKELKYFIGKDIFITVLAEFNITLPYTQQEIDEYVPSPFSERVIKSRKLPKKVIF